MRRFRDARAFWHSPAHRFAHRLHRRIWAAILASLVVASLLAALAWHLAYPALDLSTSQHRVALTDKQDQPLGEARYRATHERGQIRLHITLPDGKELIAAPQRDGTHASYAVFGGLLFIALAVGVGAMPVVKRLTRRLDALRRTIDDWGNGKLSARVTVEGCDDVAWLAQHFNQAAERIELLVNAHKLLLANASHELRSPLARLRVGIEMQRERLDPAMQVELARSVAELDQLVEEILLASRLDATAGQNDEVEAVDFTALVAEECARAGAELDAALVKVSGVPKLLRRMVRNLLDNAQRHGGSETSIEVRLQQHPDGAILTVCDGGPGVPEALREKIFEPFFRLPGAREGEGGFGLGLALVRKIAGKHGGSVCCEGRAGGGACFRVTLPASPP